MALQYIPAVLGVISSISKNNQARTQNQNQLAWGQYNTQMQYNVTMGNINMATKLAGFNFGMAKSAAAMQSEMAAMQYGLAAQSADFEMAKAAYNSSLIANTITYNNSLLDADIANVWESMGLDVKLLSNQREVERGQIAVQSFQGVVKEGDSFEDVMVDSYTQQYLDETAIKQGATRKVEEINNTIAKNLYEGQLKIQQIGWEGQINKFNILQGARANYANNLMGAASTLMQGAAGYAGSMVQAAADRQSARFAYDAGMQGAQFQYESNQQTISNNFMNGLFGSIGMGIGAYYQTKPIQSNYSFMTQSPAVSAPKTVYSTSSSYGVGPTVHQLASGYSMQGSLSTPGTTLL